MRRIFATITITIRFAPIFKSLAESRKFFRQTKKYRFGKQLLRFIFQHSNNVLSFEPDGGAHDAEPPAVIAFVWSPKTEESRWFWKKWQAEYLPTLTHRTKWFQPVRLLEIGDLSLLTYLSSPTTDMWSWPISGAWPYHASSVLVDCLKRLYGLGRLFLCVQHGQPTGVWRAWYAAQQWGRRTSRKARHYSGSSIALPHIRGQVSYWASSSQTRIRGFRQIWTVSMSQGRMWVPELYRSCTVPASSVATGSLRWIAISGCRMTGWQPASLRATHLPCCCRCWPLTQDRWIVERLQKCVPLSVRHAYVDSDYLLVGPLMLPPSVWSMPRLFAIRDSLPTAPDLSLITNNNIPRNCWPKGYVV